MIDQKSRTYTTTTMTTKKLLPLPPFSQKRLLHEKSMTFTFMFLKSRVYIYIFTYFPITWSILVNYRSIRIQFAAWFIKSAKVIANKKWERLNSLAKKS